MSSFKLKFEPVKFLTALPKVGLKAISGKYDEAGEKLLETLGEIFGVERTDEPTRQLAFLWNKATERSLQKLLRSPLNQLRFMNRDKPDFEAKLDERSQHLIKSLSHVDKFEPVEVTPEVFDAVSKMPAVDLVESRLENWLTHVGTPPGESRAIARRFKFYFVDEMFTAVREKPSDYSALFELLASPVASLWRDARSWQAYAATFRSQLAEPVFHEPYSLPDIYLWPYGYINKTKVRSHTTMSVPSEKQPDRIENVRLIFQVKHYLKDWADSPSNISHFMILSGDPGCGKSSTARMFAQELLSENRRVLYVPLHLFQLLQGQSFKYSLNEYCSLAHACPLNILDTDYGAHPLILILDGLDDLSLHGSDVGLKIADEFLSGVKKTILSKNTGAPRPQVKVLFCGRPISLQSVASALAQDVQIIHLLPYKTPKNKQVSYTDEHGTHTQYDGDISLLGKDLRKDWWHSYCTAMGMPSSDMPEEFNNEKLADITAQPLLNHLAVILYRDGSLLTDGTLRRSSLYERLFRKVYDREWGINKGHINTDVIRSGDDADQGYRDYRTLLTVLGHTAWHSGGRVISVERFEALCEKAQVKGILDRNRGKLTGGAIDFFTTFYFRYLHVAGPKTATYEFTHKTFAEYLAAARLADICEIISDNKDRGGDWVSTGPDYLDVDVLEAWMKEINNSIITTEVYELLNEVFQNRAREDMKQVIKCRRAFIALLNESIRRGMPAHKVGGISFQNMQKYAANAEYALICTLGAAIKATTDMTEPYGNTNPSENFARWEASWRAEREKMPVGNVFITWPTKTSAAELIKRIREHNERHQARNDPLPYAYYELSGQSMYGLNLTGADFTRANLYDSDMDQSCLDRAILLGASLTHVRLNRASLVGANLDGTWMPDVIMNMANLTKAKLSNSMINMAQLNGANLTEIDLTNSKLEAAHLQGATLQNAVLTGASFKGANMSGATYGSVKLDTKEGQDFLKKQGALLS